MKPFSELKKGNCLRSTWNHQVYTLKRRSSNIAEIMGRSWSTQDPDHFVYESEYNTGVYEEVKEGIRTMGTKAEEMKNTTGCLTKAADDEPIFVLRAQDKLAPVMLRMWAELAELHGAPTEKFQGAMVLADDMELWAANHQAKWPD